MRNNKGSGHFHIGHTLEVCPFPQKRNNKAVLFARGHQFCLSFSTTKDYRFLLSCNFKLIVCVYCFSCFNNLTINRFFMNASCILLFSPFPKLVWNQRASTVSSPLLLFFLLPSLLSSLFSSSFHGSCQCRITVTGQCRWAQVAVCVCVCMYV